MDGGRAIAGGASAEGPAGSVRARAGWLLGLVLLLAGCGGAAGGNVPAVEPPSADAGAGDGPAPAASYEPQSTQALATGWRYRFDMTSPPNDNNGVTTREFYLYFKPDTSGVSMRIENRLGVPVKILWDEMQFNDAYFRTSKAVHRGVTYATRDQPQEPTWIQPRQTYVDLVYPGDLLEDPAAAAGQGLREFLPTDLRAQSMVGKGFGFNLVLATEDGQRYDFDVRFRISSTYPVR